VLVVGRMRDREDWFRVELAMAEEVPRGRRRSRGIIDVVFVCQAELVMVFCIVVS
jgi:hypothetical protein